jgi:hypothetical protein
MRSSPSKAAEAIVAVLLPPACRDEVLGDLHERYRSSLQYGWEAFHTIPLVIISRIRRTADPPVVLLQAIALYASFLGAAWLQGGTFLREPLGPLRLALPAVVALLGLVLDDAYANPGRPRNIARGPAGAIALAGVSQGMLFAGRSHIALPIWITVYGCATGLILSSVVRILFPPVSDQLQGANAPAAWLKQNGGSRGSSSGLVRIIQGITGLVAAVALGALMMDHSALPKRPILPLLLIVLVAYAVIKRD